VLVTTTITTTTTTVLFDHFITLCSSPTLAINGLAMGVEVKRPKNVPHAAARDCKSFANSFRAHGKRSSLGAGSEHDGKTQVKTVVKPRYYRY